MISTAPMRSSATWSSNSIESARTSSRGRVLMASEASMRGQDSEAGPRPDGCHRHATGRRDPVSPPLDTDSVPVAGCPFVAAHRPALDARARRRHVAQPAQVPEPLRGTACPFRLPVPREFRPRRRATPGYAEIQPWIKARRVEIHTSSTECRWRHWSPPKSNWRMLPTSQFLSQVRLLL